MKNIIILAIIGVIVYHNFFKTEEQIDYSTASLRPETVVLAFGDSLTYGTGAGKESSYPSQLSKMIGLPVINAGVPGEITEQGLARLPKVLDQYKPTLLLLCHGGNDILQHLNLEKTKENIEQMINLAQARGITVILIGVPQWSGLLVNTASFYDEIANDTGVGYEDSVLFSIIIDSTIKNERVHPNRTGYRIMAEKVRDTIFANY